MKRDFMRLPAAMIIIMIFCAHISGCSKSSIHETAPSQESRQQESAETDISGEEQQASEYFIYEAIFLDNDEITALFEQVRGEAPFEIVTKDFHVTTQFMPETTHEDWYGEKVSIHIISYKSQEIQRDDGSMTSNEGFKVEVSVENPELQKLLESLNKNFHVTGSYKDEGGAKYTEYIDFSDGEPLDLYVIGTFGCGDSNDVIDLGPDASK